MKTGRHAVTLAAMVIGVGCQMPPSLSINSLPRPMPVLMGNGAVSQQLIVKFKPNTIACDAPEIAHLSAVTGVLLEHVRPMPGGACVVQQWAANADDLSHGQETLKQHPDIEWLEEDRMMKAL